MFVAKHHAMSHVANQSIGPSRNHVLCLASLIFSPTLFASLSNDDVDVIGVSEYLCLPVEYCAFGLQFCLSYDNLQYDIEEKRR
jgi:hypothetical protein